MIFTKFGQYVGQGEYNYKAPASHVPTIWGQCCRQRDNQLGLRLLMATGVNSISIDFARIDNRKYLYTETKHQFHPYELGLLEKWWKHKNFSPQ